jgi:hypothetical protein
MRYLIWALPITAAAAVLLSVSSQAGTVTTCSAATLTGSYGVTVTQPSFVINGLYAFDGTGHVIGRETNVPSGSSPQVYSVTGAYTVDADCSVTLSLKYRQGRTVTDTDTFTGVVVNGGKKMTAVLTKAANSFGPMQVVFEAVH